MCMAEINKKNWYSVINGRQVEKGVFAGIGKANSFGEKNNTINLMGLA